MQGSSEIAGFKPETIQFVIAAWGALLATLLGGIKLYETFWKDRLRLETTYSFTAERGVADTIFIANLRSVPVQVRSWKLVWEPRLFHRHQGQVDVTPDWASHFKLDGNGFTALSFDGQDKFDWGQRNALDRRLYLVLWIFGRRRSKKLLIVAGM